MTTCSVEGCTRPHDGRGLCAMHRQRVVREYSTPLDYPLPSWGAALTPYGYSPEAFAEYAAWRVDQNDQAIARDNERAAADASRYPWLFDDTQVAA